MWEDPWKDLIDEGDSHNMTSDLSTTKFALIDSEAESFDESSVRSDCATTDETPAISAESTATEEIAADDKTDEAPSVNTPEDLLKLITS